MKHYVALGLVLGTALLSSPAWATNPRTFVSAAGTDTGTCRPTTPCRTFAFALGQTDPGGEIVAEDPANYGQVTITQAITIEADGVYAGVPVPSGNGITVGAGPNDVVILRGLTIKGNGGSNGILFNSGSALHVENCVINGINSGGNGIGIDVLAGNLFVKDTIVRNNDTGIEFNSAGASLERVRLEGNVDGLDVFANGKVSISNSVGSGNTGTAISADGSIVEINVESCLIANNDTGISAVYSTIRVSNSTVTDNTTGLSAGEGTILSRGNNTIEGNSMGNDSLGSYTAK